jgi:DNA-directed RNA polymerase subunit RPC12/RpoP
MDIVFDCPNCSQELAVDSAGAGSEIECPSCHETITIPTQSTKVPAAPAPSETAPAPSLAPSAIATSAAAKVEMHLKVPVRDTPGEVLITKPKPPLGSRPPGQKGIRSHTIRHSGCIEAGHDKFDEKVTEFLSQTGEANIISTHTISYTYFDVGTQKILNDYGLLVIYRG